MDLNLIVDRFSERQAVVLDPHRLWIDLRYLSSRPQNLVHVPLNELLKLVLCRVQGICPAGDWTRWVVALTASVIAPVPLIVMIGTASSSPGLVTCPETVSVWAISPESRLLNGRTPRAPRRIFTTTCPCAVGRWRHARPCGTHRADWTGKWLPPTPAQVQPCGRLPGRL